MKKYTRVDFDCIGCGEKHSTTTHNLRYRKHHKNEHYCRNCLIKLDKASDLFDNLPKEWYPSVFKWEIQHNIAVKYLRNVNSKIPVIYQCKNCGKECRTEWLKILSRKNHMFSRLCYTCLQKSINTSEDVLKNHRKRSVELWKSPNYREKCIKAFEDHNKRMQLEPEYANKNKRKSRSISGTVLINDKHVGFDSGFELVFLDHVADQCEIIRRCEFPIRYGNRYYHPDFYIIYKSGRTAIIEIKGYYRNNVEEKAKHAEEYIKEHGVADEYLLYDTDKLIDQGILKGTGGGNLWKQILEINNDRIIEFSEEKHREIAEIGLSRFRKKNKNQKNNKI